MHTASSARLSSSFTTADIAAIVQWCGSTAGGWRLCEAASPVAWRDDGVAYISLTNDTANEAEAVFHIVAGPGFVVVYAEDWSETPAASLEEALGHCARLHDEAAAEAAHEDHIDAEAA